MEMEELNKSGKIKIVEVHTEMAVYYSRPKLESLSQKDRLSFIRQVRHLSLKELGMKMGIPSSQSKYRIWRMERKGRDIPPDVRSKVCEAPREKATPCLSACSSAYFLHQYAAGRDRREKSAVSHGAFPRQRHVGRLYAHGLQCRGASLP